MKEAWPDVEWDRAINGYPTESSLKAIAVLPLDFKSAAKFVRQELARCAEHCCASFKEEDAIDRNDQPIVKVHFSTGGWSGAEDLMELISSRFDACHFMAQWNKGGHYIFEFPMTGPLATAQNKEPLIEK